jgi:hypothetical protein
MAVVFTSYDKTVEDGAVPRLVIHRSMKEGKGTGAYLRALDPLVGRTWWYDFRNSRRERPVLYPVLFVR